MKNNTTFFKRMISVVVCMALIMSCIPTILNVSAETTGNSYYNRVVDSNTMNGWTEYFDIRDGHLDTSNAGGVWTDKSVFTDASAFPSSVQMLDSDKNLLTALSVIAANKEVVGYSTVPTDTVLILDLSNSMPQTARTQLINAANNAMKELFKVNNNNRVGVVLYSGSSSNRGYSNAVTRLLPIDRYNTTRQDGNYISYRNGEVSVYDGVTGTNPSAAFGEKDYGGATYIQAGLWEAWQMFEDIDTADTVIDDNNWQSGEARMPIVLLMSDGAPTLGTTYFDDVSNSRYNSRYGTVYGADVGDGSDSGITAGQSFLVQLTASYIKNRIENHYNIKDGAGRSLFYTLGFNINADNNANTVTAGDIAYSVLNPDSSTVTDALWNTYKNTNSSTMQVRVEGRGGGYSDVTINKNSYATSKSYVDQYFSAAGDGLENAFKEIVDEIILQSRYYPTHLGGGNPDFSGYVEFKDRLGEYMEVKDIKGILLGDTLFDGHKMASKLTDNTASGLGSVTAPTALGDEFIASVKTRLDISSTSEARLLVQRAWNAKQLWYNVDEDNNIEWSNYIGWYAKADGTYLSFWDENSTEPAPEGAVYKNKSYGFLGETTGSIKNSDMMYMTVQVSTNISTGQQSVVWKVPAALVPMITYLVTLSGTNVDAATDVTVSIENKQDISPIRLIFETGLRSDLNEFNISRITDEAHIDSDGVTRKFWNNYFDISNASHDKHVTTVAEFTPSKENERFYYTFDSVVYKKSGNNYEKVANGELTEGGEYYHRHYIFTDNSTVPVFLYEKISKETLQIAITKGWQANFKVSETETGAYIVPQGTVARELTPFDKQKQDLGAATQSARMVFHPYITTENEMSYVDMNLGNNGLLKVTPAQGIKISKTIDIYESGTSDTFKFRITANTAAGVPLSSSFDSWVTSLDITPDGEAVKASFTNGVYEFELKKDQTFWLIGLEAGTTYSVEEISDNDDYKIKSVHVNSVATGKVATGAVAAYHIDDVDFINTAISEGDLVITKRVVNQNGATVDINDSVKFTANVTLTDAKGDPVYGTFNASNAAGSITIPANGSFTVTLSEGESLVIHGIPEETRYTITETNIPAGFSFNAMQSSMNGVIDATANDQALIVNTYAPTAVAGSDINVVINKLISGNRTSWLNGESYEFTVERSNLSGVYSVIKTATIRYDDAIKSHSFNLSDQTFTDAGSYYFKITEKIGNQGGITYDTAERRFRVDVADSDMNGTLEIISVVNEGNVTVSGNYTATATFTNVYAPVGSASVTIDIEKAMNGNHALNGFQFALYSDAALDNEIVKSTVTDIYGKANIKLTYAPNRATVEGTTYTYYLAELDTQNPNIDYTDAVYKIDVTVKDNGDGTTSATKIITLVGGSNVNTPVFTNTYVPSGSDYVVISGKKIIDGDRILNNNEFEFKLTPITAGAPMPANDTVRNAADGSFVFPAIEFADAHKGNSYEYAVTEINNAIGGFTYDTSSYKVVVTVTDNGDATLTASTVITKDNNPAEIVFINKYVPTPIDNFTISGEKILTGKTLNKGDFSFEIKAASLNAPMPSATVVKNGATVEMPANKFTFGPITYTKAGVYTYTIEEVDDGDARYDYDKSIYTVIITVHDNSEGRLFANIEIKRNNMEATAIVFQNGFVPTPLTYNISANFGGEKQLDGRQLAENEFEFKLINAINGQQIGETVRNDAVGEFKFPSITLPEEGIYHYKITEVAGDAKGVSYDTSAYHVRIEVVQDDNGILHIVDSNTSDGIEGELYKGTVTKETVGGVLTEVVKYDNITGQGNIVFNNTYKALPAHVTLQALKTLNGRELVDGEFKFDLHKTDSSFTYDDNTLVQDDVALSLNDDGTGTVTFATIGFDAADNYYYVVVEDELDEKGIVSDKTEYKVEIKVEDNHMGDFNVAIKVNGTDINETTSEVIKFANTYKATPTDIVITGTKTLTGRDLADREFEFTLYDKDLNALSTVANKADGGFEFDKITVSEQGEYFYTVKEVMGDAEGITYDESVYTVKVTVTDNLDGTFTVDYKYSKGAVAAEKIEFANRYTAPNPDSPKTGDGSHLWLWFALMFVSAASLATAFIIGKKTVKEE